MNDKLNKKTSLILYPVSLGLNNVLDKFRDYKILDSYLNNSEFISLEKLLKSKNSKILFTSLLNYNLVNSFMKINCTCVILETWGYDTCQFIQSNDIDNLFKIKDCDKNIDIIVQEVEPDKKTLDLISELDDIDIKRLLTVYIYPKEVEDLPDKPVDYQGWIDNNTKLSNKLSSIIDNIDNGKHIIYTNFDDKYGVNLIKSLLYVNDIFTTSKIEIYNKNDDVVLVTNVSIEEEIIGLNNIHIVDNYNIDLINKTLRQLKSNNCDDIKIYLYPVKNTIDYKDCQCFENKLKGVNLAYIEMINSSIYFS